MEEFTGNEKFEGLSIVSDHINVDMMLVSEKPIKTAREAIDFVAGKIYDRSEEMAVAIFCDDNLVPLFVATPDKGGTLHNRMFIPKDIVQTAQIYNASCVTLLYSHSGLSSGGEKCSPSRDYIAMTKAIVDECRIVDVKVCDSIVVSPFRKSPFAEPVYYSIMERGLEDS